MNYTDTLSVIFVISTVWLLKSVSLCHSCRLLVLLIEAFLGVLFSKYCFFHFRACVRLNDLWRYVQFCRSE